MTFYTYKVMLKPNNKQKTKLKQTMNKVIECQNIIYDLIKGYLDKKERIPECALIRKQFTLIKKEKDNEVIEKRKNMTHSEIRLAHLDVLFYDVSNDALKQQVKDTYNSFIKFFMKKSSFPTKKEYKSKHKGFYVDPYKIEVTDTHIKLEKIADSMKSNRQVLNYIKLAEKERIPKNVPLYNPRVTYDGDRFYFTVSVEQKYAPKKKEKIVRDETIEIDMNIKEIVTSEDVHYKSINKENKIIKANKRLKRLQRKCSRKYEIHKITNKPLRECNNFIKVKRLINKQYIKLKNLRDDRTTRVIEDIFIKPPNTIVVEDLDIKSMQKNKQISSKIQQESFRKFFNKLKIKASKYDIKIIVANRYYPSSKKCSCCGNIKKDLKLKDRTYKCNNCNLKINRDYNAAINLRNYLHI